MQKWLKVFYLGLFFMVSVSHADTVLEQRSMFTGHNIYSPMVMYDGGVYKMWYGGEQTSGQSWNDVIYYRTSTDNTNWSTEQMLFGPSQIAPSGTYTHVNDPTVTKHFNSANGLWQYTMFYTACRAPCDNQLQNEIWSAVSSNGISWGGHQLLLTGASGPAEPSAIIESPSPDGTTFWKVYYVDRNDNTRVKLAKVTGARNATKTQVVYQSSNNLANPEVRLFNGMWHLFFNVYLAAQADIYKTVSGSNETFSGTQQPIILNNPPSAFCGTITPGLRPIQGNQYDLYFSLTPRGTAGECLIANNFAIQRWRMAE